MEHEGDWGAGFGKVGLLIYFCIKISTVMKDNSEEIFPIVDEEGNVVGKATRGECHSGSMLLHPVVHLHVFDRDSRIYLQRRPDWKDIQPGKWDTAVGGHIDYGETVEEALRREVREELGISQFAPEFVARYVFESSVEKELVNTFRATVDEVPKPSAELDGGRYWTREEIEENIGKDVFTPNLENELRSLFL